MKLAGKVAIVTGGTDGIGKAIAVAFAKEGAKLMIVGRDEAKGQKALSEVQKHSEAAFLKVDVSKSSQVKQMVEETIRRYGRVDVLVNNAAVAPAGTVATTSEELWDSVININLKGVFLCSKYVIPHMQENGGGSIVNIGSINSIMAMENEAAYDASKGGVLMLTKTIALDFAKYNIRANCICPGCIDTRMLDQSVDASPDPKAARQSLIQKHPLRRLGRPEEVAQAALFLATDSSSFITGATFPVDGGILAGWT